MQVLLVLLYFMQVTSRGHRYLNTPLSTIQPCESGKSPAFKHIWRRNRKYVEKVSVFLTACNVGMIQKKVS